ILKALVSTLIAHFLSFILVKPSGNSNRDIAINICYYSVGFQYLTYLPISLAFIVLIILGAPDSLIYSIPLGFLLWGVFVFYRLISNSVIEDLRGKFQAIKKLWLLFCALGLTLTITILGWGISLSLAISDFLAIQWPPPKISLALISSSDDDSSFRTLVRNNSSAELVIMSDDTIAFGSPEPVTKCGRWLEEKTPVISIILDPFIEKKIQKYKVEIVENGSKQVPEIILTPSELRFLTIRYEKMGKPQVCKDCYNEDIIEFKTISPNSKHQNIRAYIRDNETIFSPFASEKSVEASDVPLQFNVCLPSLS
ncbi:MAG: hypothetical protein AAF629_34530, partial [Chloroflexota bacterium]